MTAPRKPVTAALVELLGAGTSRPVQVGTAPAEALDPQPELPYVVVYPLPSPEVSGPYLGDGHAFVTWHYDVMAVGARMDQVELILDKAVAAMVGLTNGGVPTMPWPAPAGEPSQRRLIGWGPTGTSDDRKLVWGSVELAVAQLS